jgi:hypothetical protein
MKPSFRLPVSSMSLSAEVPMKPSFRLPVSSVSLSPEVPMKPSFRLPVSSMSLSAEVPMKPSSRSPAVLPTGRRRRRPCRRPFTTDIVFAGVERELGLSGSVYARIRPDDLAGYPVLADLVACLSADAVAGDTARTDLVATLIATHQARPHRIWSALLLVAFRPMLMTVFKKLVGELPDERLALLLASFQEALGKVDPRHDTLRIGMYVRQATRRGVFAALRTRRAWKEVGFGVSAKWTPDEGGETRTEALDRLIDLRARKIVSTLPPAEARLALRALADEGPMGPLAEQDRAYRKLLRRRQRAAARRKVAETTSLVRTEEA